MKFIHAAITTTAMAVLTACGGGGTESTGPGPDPGGDVPSTGLYASTQYTLAQLTEYKNVKYSQRPNGGGQYTSD